MELKSSRYEGLGRVGLGTFPLSGVFSPVDERSATEIIESFLGTGERYIETAPSYPRRVDLGSILARFPRETFTIASKCVTNVSLDGVKERTGKYDAVVGQCEAELRRLRVDYLDVLQAHITPEDVDPAETMEALESLRQRGLVRLIGVSNVSLEQLKAFAKGGSVELIQNRVSMVHRSSYAPLVDYCREHDIYFNPFQVIERGQLTSQTPNPDEWRETDLRRSKAEYSGDAYLTIRNWFLEHIGPIAAEMGCSGETLAISWVLNRPMVKLCVVGATTKEQVLRNVQGGDLIMSPSAMDRIETAYSLLAAEVRNRYGLSIEEYRGLGG
jgi:aryl-alcohol dehydrogenase-like predicted oxidoreductase